MAEIVNLRRVKRARARAEAASLAAENRARHGQSKAGRAALQKERDRAGTVLDGAALSAPEPPTAQTPGTAPRKSPA